MKASVSPGYIVMPAGLRGFEGGYTNVTPGDDNIGTCVILSLPEFQLYLRTHDYYMGKIPLESVPLHSLSTYSPEMSLNVDTIHATVHDKCSEDLRQVPITHAQAKETAVIDGAARALSLSVLLTYMRM